MVDLIYLYSVLFIFSKIYCSPRGTVYYCIRSNLTDNGIYRILIGDIEPDIRGSSDRAAVSNA